MGGLGAEAGIAVVDPGMVVVPRPDVVMVPRPDMIYLVSRSIAQGRRAGLVSPAGVSFGFPVPLLAVSAGIATVFALVPEIYLAIRPAGAGHLLRPAWKAVRPGGRSALATGELAPDGARRLFLAGILTCPVNPQVAILHVSLLPQFADPERPCRPEGTAVGDDPDRGGGESYAFFGVTAGSVPGFFARHPLWQRLRRHRCVRGTAPAGSAVRMATERTGAVAAPR